MMALLFYFLAAFGFAFIVGHSKISLLMRELLAGIPEEQVFNTALPEQGALTVRSIVRPAIPPLIPFFGPWLAALLECPACMGWWIGLSAGTFAPDFFWHAAPGITMSADLAHLSTVLIVALATSASNLLFSKFIGLV